VDNDNVTVRIEEREKPSPESATQVVFIPPSQQQLYACYFRGYSDASEAWNIAIILLSMAVALLAFLLVRNNAAK
jgi:hypothetical protein